MSEISANPIRFGPAIVGSLAGTMVFGMMMTMMGMMDMIASLVGSSSVLVGWLVHMAIGALFGLGFALFAAAVPLRAWASGLIYGMGIWMIGPLVIMPLWLGTPGLVFNLASSTPWLSLMGHMVYGLVTGLVFGVLTRPRGASTSRGAAA